MSATSDRMRGRSDGAAATTVSLCAGDALVVVDMQNDFVTGSLAVPGGAAVVPTLDRWIAAFVGLSLPVFATRDWHPPDHCSFRERGGVWPTHCVAGTEGARFVPGLALPPDAIVISKATAVDREAYSTFSGTDLDRQLRARNIERIFIGGLATDYCVVESVRDARQLGYEVCVLGDAIRAVNVHPDDGAKAEAAMRSAGAALIAIDAVAIGAAPAGARS
jgi:nicotinamidase/pyrazinamidase